MNDLLFRPVTAVVLKKLKYLVHFRKIRKKKFGLTRNGGEGVKNMEKYFFAFLDELDHLEAIKILIICGK